MTTLKDIYLATDFLTAKRELSMPLYWDHYTEGSSNIHVLRQPNGCNEYSFLDDAVVEVFYDGSVSIDGIAFLCYVSQQIKFEPTQE